MIPVPIRFLVCAGIAVSLLACSQGIKKTSRNIYREPSTEPAGPVVSPLPSTVSVEEARALAPVLEIKPDTAFKGLLLKPVYPQPQKPQLEVICERVSRRLASVGYEDCMDLELEVSEAPSVEGFPLVFKRYYPRPDEEPLGRVLVLGGTHGDELTSVSIVFKWMGKLDQYHSGAIEWLVAPLVNPDGAMRNPAARTNARGIDLNRNLATPDWLNESSAYWLRTNKDPRHSPGFRPNSEPETRWVVKLIEDFEPDVIVSVHAPLNLLDFDALDRDISPLRLGILKKDLRGTFPGSLGNYAGIQLGIPVITIELPHLWRMPRPTVVTGLWVDTVSWLKLNMEKAQAQRLMAKRSTVATHYQ